MVESELKLREATRLAARGMFKCFRCHQVAPQDQGLVLSFAGNVLLAIHPECMDGRRIVISKDGGRISVTMPKPEESSLIQIGHVQPTGLVLARPHVEKVKL